MRIEEKYEDVLQNMEFGIINVYRKNPELNDYDTLDAIQALMRYYTAEESHQNPPSIRLSEKAQLVFDSVKSACELRLSRETLFDKRGRPLDLQLKPLEVSEIIACLQRIRKSIRSWSKREGSQGYLKFVSQFIS